MEVRFGGTSKPARETRALPGVGASPLFTFLRLFLLIANDWVCFLRHANAFDMRPAFSNNHGMPSLKKIASSLGVSYTLVSKVLSGRMGTTGVRAATRDAILKKAKALNYRPNRLAVALKGGRKGSVGLFIHTVGTPGTEMTQQFIINTVHCLNNAGLQLWLRFFQTDQEFLTACDEKLTRDIDGLIVAGSSHAGLIEKLHQIDQSGLPVVMSFINIQKSPLSGSVSVDFELQGYLPTRHLLEKGCRRLAHFNANELRYRGFKRAHKEMGVAVQKDLVITAENKFDFASGETATAALLQKKTRFDGIVAQSDAQAVGAVRVLLQHGIRVPEDVRVTGVDDSPLAEACIVPLTSSTSQIDECGRCAALSLLKKIEGEPVESRILVPTLTIRESSR